MMQWPVVLSELPLDAEFGNPTIRVKSQKRFIRLYTKDNSSDGVGNENWHKLSTNSPIILTSPEVWGKIIYEIPI